MEKQNCRMPAGTYIPVINLNKCEGAATCVDVCPKNVLAMRELSDTEYDELSFLGKLKTKAHGRRKAIAVNASNCEACGACIKACPESAIKLQKTT